MTKTQFNSEIKETRFFIENAILINNVSLDVKAHSMGVNFRNTAKGISFHITSSELGFDNYKPIDFDIYTDHIENNLRLLNHNADKNSYIINMACIEKQKKERLALIDWMQNNC